MKRLFALLLALAMLFTLAACGTDAEKEASKPTVKETTASPANTTPPRKPTKQEVETAAIELYYQAEKAAKEQNYSAFSSLYTDSRADEVSTLYRNWNAQTPMDQHYCSLVCEKDGYYYVSVVHAITTGVGSNADAYYRSELYALKQTADGWKMVLLGDDRSVYIEQLNQSAKDAREAGRNFIIFNNAFEMCFLDSNIAVQGVMISDCAYAWQDADGYVYLAIYLSNGTDVNQSIDTLEISLSDQELGEILDVRYTEDVILAAHSSSILTLKVAPNKVRTGMKPWGWVSINVRAYH